MNNPIYIIDDLRIIADLIQHTLEMVGFKRCRSFENPLEMLDTLTFDDPPGLIITDFEMPDINGVELLKKISLELPRLKGIIMTSDPDAAMKLCPDYPILSKLNRTFKDDLLKEVELALGQKAVFPLEFWAA